LHSIRRGDHCCAGNFGLDRTPTFTPTSSFVLLWGHWYRQWLVAIVHFCYPIPRFTEVVHAKGNILIVSATMFLFEFQIWDTNK
jgi:hypothetical protein